MTKQLRRLMVGALALGAVTACDDGTDPIATADVEILAYVDADNSNDFDATADDPIQGATVTLTMVGDDSNVLTETTGAGGVATFVAVEIGSYTASIELPATMTGVTLASASTPTVTVEEDIEVSAAYRYTYNPGSITGHAFLGSGDYTEGDVVVPGLAVALLEGGTEVASTATDASGAYAFTGRMPGDYTVEVDVPAYLSTSAASRAVTVGADAEATADFAFEATATHTIAEARAAAAGDLVAVTGVAITGNAGDQAALSGSSFYMQDESGISIYLDDVVAAVELGDSVLVYGERGAFNSEVQLSSLAVLVLGEGTIPTPVTVTPTAINNGEYQGQLGIVQDVFVDEVGMDGGDPTGNVFVSDLETGVDLVIYIDSDAGIDIAATFEEGKVYDVTGVVARYGDLFELKPRMPADVVEETAPGMTVADVRAAAVDAAVEVTGVVTEAGTLEGNGFYMEDATAGIFVYMGYGNVPADLAIGDVVTVTGARAQYFNIAQIGGTVDVTKTGVMVTPVPTPVLAPELNSGDVQGQLVVMVDVVVDSVSGSNVYVSDANGDDALVRIDSDSEIAVGGFVVDELYTVAGVVSNYNGEQLKPRFPEDVEGVVVVEPATTIAEARAAAAGTPAELTGVVTVATGMIDSRNAYMQDGTAGILIRMPTDSAVAVGDSVTVTGTTGAYNSELQISVDGLTRLGTGTVPDARVVTPAEINAGSYQGELAVLEAVEVTLIDGLAVTVTDGTTETVVYVDSDTGIDVGATFTVGSSYTVTGVLSRYNDLFELKPRDASDIVAN